ncbi:MAG: imidazoleglycerol-phosphate dehydratase HisB [Gemmatimonadota bacterium]|nr:imidazoleglycerol-phosphate dehydratase HisB [Gemmatimonadota bacterium]
MSSPRTATIERKTRETDIRLTLDLDGQGESSVDTGIGFFDHMLQTFARHSGFDLEVICKGDLEVDEHHTVEDIGLVLGQALDKALGDKAGIARFAESYVPMDESLSRVVADISGRGLLVFNCKFSRDNVGAMSTELAGEFWRAVASRAGITLHMEILYGGNAHHQVESLFKAAARTLKAATGIVPGSDDIPSTKGVL